MTYDALDTALDGQAERLIKQRRPYIPSPREWWATLTEEQQRKWATSLERDLCREEAEATD